MRSTAAVICVILTLFLLISCEKNSGEPSPELMGGYLQGTDNTTSPTEATGKSTLDPVSHTTAENLSYSIPTASDEPLTDDDILLITHLVSCEMGSFPYMTQVCFAAMILNRIDDPGFPTGARGVVFDSGDFKSVISGEVNGSIPSGFKATSKYRIASKAVNEALSGKDPTGGALYFALSEDNSSGIAPSHECGGVFFGS